MSEAPLHADLDEQSEIPTATVIEAAKRYEDDNEGFSGRVDAVLHAVEQAKPGGALDRAQARAVVIGASVALHSLAGSDLDLSSEMKFDITEDATYLFAYAGEDQIASLYIGADLDVEERHARAMLSLICHRRAQQAARKSDAEIAAKSALGAVDEALLSVELDEDSLRHAHELLAELTDLLTSPEPEV